MIDTILFDLDGTLLPMDTELFLKSYFKAVAVKLKDFFTAEEVMKYFWRSTQYMINNTNPDKTNEEAFFEDFFKDGKMDQQELVKLLDDFYENEFEEVLKTVEANELVVASVKMLKHKGYDLVVATNPLFPRSAILKRIERAGLNKEDFIFITSFEHMHYCKPHVEYYQEILKNIDKKPSECLMVGNHMKEDMIAKELGIQTYLINNHLIGDLSKDENVDHQGEYTDFFDYIKKLPIAE